MRSSAIASITLATLALVPCWGCGSSENKPFVGETLPVKGKITYKGKPLTRGQIMFEPLNSGREGHARIGPDGSFVVTTFKEGDGAVKGVHRISVSGAGRLPTSSKNEVEVSEGKTDYAIDLK